MANDKNLAQLTNQEVILEEISEEELEGVTGGVLVSALGVALATLVVRVTNGVDELATSVLSFGPPA